MAEAPVTRAALLALLCAACHPTVIRARYTPLHPDNQAPVDVKFAATDDDGIDQATLYVFRYELPATPPASGDRGAVKVGEGRRFDFPHPERPTSVEHTVHLDGFPPRTLVSVVLEITDGKHAVSNEEWRFAAGDWPWADRPIPLWENGDQQTRINVGFAPAPAPLGGFASTRDLLTDLEGLIFDGYHRSEVIDEQRRNWQFYYTPDTGSMTDFNASIAAIEVPAALSVGRGIDAAAVVHRVQATDFALGDRFTTESDRPGTALHETSHVVFDLGDEYPGGVYRWAGEHANNHYSLVECQKYNAEHGAAGVGCEPIPQSSPQWFRTEPASESCIMRHDGKTLVAPFGSTCRRRVEWFYRNRMTRP